MLSGAFQILFLPLKLISLIFPKDDNLWVFGSWAGQKYADNPKYLYEYINKNSKKDRAVWLTKNRIAYKKISGKGYKVSYFYSPSGIWYALRAKYIVFCIGYQDLSYFCYLLTTKSELINLWHGTPLKKLDFPRSMMNRISRAAFLGLLGRECDYVCSSSQIVTDKLQNYFNIARDKYLVTGYPRNDALFSKDTSSIADTVLSQIDGKKVVLYLPTFRQYLTNGRRVNLFKEYNFNETELTKVLKKNNSIMLIKMHPRDATELNAIRNKQNPHIMVVSDDQIDGDVYPLLTKTDVLITDYSSVFFDYLLLDGPVIFASFDLSSYQTQDRGFYFDYDSVTPGPKAQDWKELTSLIEDALQDRDKERRARKAVTHLMNRYIDGNSSKRFYKNIKSGT